MADIIGFDNSEEHVHRLSNSLDGSLELRIFADKAKGVTVVRFDGSEVCRSDAGEGQSPYFCGSVSIPRGEFTFEVTSEATPDRLILTEKDDIPTAEAFDLMYMNRKMSALFEHDPVEYTPEVLELLKRHGFIYEQAHDTADGLEPSGVPLGGMGCGKLEITADGMFTAFTGNNNQDCPIYRMPGSFMAISDGSETRLIRKDPLSLPYRTAAGITSDLEFPFARVVCADPDLNAAAEIRVFSPHIPGNAADSSLPCVFFDVELKNVSSEDVNASFCFSWENLINVGGSMMTRNAGERLFPLCYHTWNPSYPWSDRRANRCVRKDGALLFCADDDRGNPSSFGEHLLWCSDPGAECVPDRSILPEDEAAFAGAFAGGGYQNAVGGSEFRAGAWIVRRRLGPRESVRFSFILVWYMPRLTGADGRDYGVEYANRFGSAAGILDYCVKNRERLYSGTRIVNDAVGRSSLPQWFKRRLLDDRFVANTCSWYDKYGDFSINEAPTGMSGCLGTLDQRTASQVYYTTFFPELDDKELELFRLSQAPDGMCAHEIGFSAIKLEARPFSKWPDLADSYVIQVFHHYQRTGDRGFLERHWPHMKKAIEWTLTLDDAGCGIPYICPGRGTTYDNQFWEGVNSFISTMQIAAYRIGARAARIVGDDETSREWESLAEKAWEYRAGHLWNEKDGYFYNAYDPKGGKTDDSCFIASLAGEWAVMRAGIVPSMSYEDIGRAASEINSRCSSESGITDQGGRRDETAGFMQYPMAYLASASLYAGNAEAAWRFAEINDRVLTQPGVSTHFDQGLTYMIDGKRHGLPYYMTAPASWNMLEALSGVYDDAASGVLKLAPYTPGGLRLPVFLTGCGFEIVTDEEGSEMRLEPVYSVADHPVKRLMIAGKWGSDISTGSYDGGYTVFDVSFDPGKQGVILKNRG
ncbi:MAG: hypothetical protein K6D94_09615 [Clostridiales bacterium]|nr:hypothetical protein [Clostridiales bacterium]